jgi:hypothetical protein
MRGLRKRPGRILAIMIAVAVLLGLSIGVDKQGRIAVEPTPPAFADDDFFNSSPGDLSKSHASLDNSTGCNSCHDGGKEVIQAKCLDCHDHQNLKARIDAGKGFHASSLVKGKRCENCHVEHKGKSKDIMGWSSVQGGEAGFNHDLTGWALKGKHATIDCADCHKSRNQQGLKVYLGNDKLCGSCHKDDQPHKYERREMLACERCHGESVWKPAKSASSMDFDHNKKADALMPLEGAHADVSCTKCHPKSVFNLPANKPDNCGNSGCHTSPHDGHLFGKKDCAWCHSPTYKELKKFKFDHGSKTKFELGSTHGKLDCYTCHSKAEGERKPEAACESSGCHAKDNKHGDRFEAFGKPLPRCSTCHPSSSWKPTTFSHDKHTGFKLTARHAEISCRNCHRGKTPSDFERFDKSLQCKGCHEHKKAHADKEDDPLFADNRKKCLNCHEQPGSRDMKRESAVKAVHGPQSRFPLVKAHKDVSCESCHDQRGRDGKPTFKNTPTECGERCHEDSLHNGKLGQECSRCHAPGIWEATRFVHNDDTKFELKGLHQKIPTCDSCHPTREFTGTPTACSDGACHGDDDAHRGRLGEKCEQCHVETGDNIFSHNTMADFVLEGKHLDVRCADCHPSVTFKPRPKNCFGCHPEPSIHKGQYGTVCEQCHTTRTFEDIRPLHDVGDFSLQGMHDSIACNRCHKDNRPLAGSGNLCINCHRQDDIHSNSLSPRCGECHTQWSFAPARFDHSRVGCNLTGLHRTMPCFDCHKQGAFGATIPTCVGCHRDDAQRHAGGGADTQNHNGQQICSTCHTVNAWLPAGTGLGVGKESVCR